MVYKKSNMNADLMLSEPPNVSTIMRTSTDQQMLQQQVQT